MSRIPALGVALVVAACGTLESAPGGDGGATSGADGGDGAVPIDGVDGGARTEAGTVEGGAPCGGADLFCDDFEAASLDSKWLPALAGGAFVGVDRTTTNPIHGSGSLRATFAKAQPGNRAERYRAVGSSGPYSVRLYVQPSLDLLSSSSLVRLFALQRIDSASDGVSVIAHLTGGAGSPVQFDVEYAPQTVGSTTTKTLGTAPAETAVCFTMRWDGTNVIVHVATAASDVTITPNFVPSFLYVGLEDRNATDATCEVTYDDVAVGRTALSCP